MIWKNITGWPGYSISENGDIIGKRGRPLRLFTDEWGYKHFSACRGSRETHEQRRMLVHRAVALEFLPPPPTEEHIIVAHRDGNPANNWAGNLRWSTHLENNMDKLAHGTMPMGEFHSGSKLTDFEVRNIRASSDSNRTLSKKYGVFHTTIAAIKQGKTWKHIV